MVLGVRPEVMSPRREGRFVGPANELPVTVNVVEVLGDGVLAEFPAPGEALRATQALVEAARGQGLRIRAGLHAGEVYQVGERLLGICVNAAARVADRAGASEVLATEIVRDDRGNVYVRCASVRPAHRQPYRWYQFWYRLEQSE